jgi:hypothetical protein
MKGLTHVQDAPMHGMLFLTSLCTSCIPPVYIHKHSYIRATRALCCMHHASLGTIFMQEQPYICIHIHIAHIHTAEPKGRYAAYIMYSVGMICRPEDHGTARLMNVCERLLAASLEAVDKPRDTTPQGADIHRPDHDMHMHENANAAYASKDGTHRDETRVARERRMSDMSVNSNRRASADSLCDSEDASKGSRDVRREHSSRSRDKHSECRHAGGREGDRRSGDRDDGVHVGGRDDEGRCRDRDAKHVRRDDDGRVRGKDDHKNLERQEGGRGSRDRDAKHVRRDDGRSSRDKDSSGKRVEGHEGVGGWRDTGGASRGAGHVGASEDTRHTLRHPHAPASSRTNRFSRQDSSRQDSSRQDSHDTCNERRHSVGGGSSRPSDRSCERQGVQGSAAAKQTAREHARCDASPVSSRSSHEESKSGYTYRDCMDDFKNGSEASAADTCVLRHETEPCVRRKASCTLSCDDALRALWGCAVHGMCALEWQMVLWNKVLRKWNHAEVAKVRARVCGESANDETRASEQGDQAHAWHAETEAGLKCVHSDDEKVKVSNMEVSAGDACCEGVDAGEQSAHGMLNARGVKLHDGGMKDAEACEATGRGQADGVQGLRMCGGDHVMQDVHANTSEECKGIAGGGHGSEECKGIAGGGGGHGGTQHPDRKEGKRQGRACDKGAHNDDDDACTGGAHDDDDDDACTGGAHDDDARTGDRPESRDMRGPLKMDEKSSGVDVDVGVGDSGVDVGVGDLMQVSGTLDMLRQVAVSWRNAGWRDKDASTG